MGLSLHQILVDFHTVRQGVPHLVQMAPLQTLILAMLDEAIPALDKGGKLLQLELVPMLLQLHCPLVLKAVHDLEQSR